MILSGLTILAFVIYHMLHFTARIGNEYNTLARYKTTIHGVEGEVHVMGQEDDASVRAGVIDAVVLVARGSIVTGTGTLTFHGRTYPLSIGGLSAGLVFGAQVVVLP